MDKIDYVNAILNSLRGKTGMNFQRGVQEVFKIYWKNVGKTYEMPSAYGGDKKNDGWVVEDALFYQIYAPARNTNNKTLKKNMQEKYTEDLEGLLEHVCEEGLWGGEVHTFIFLVNTFDDNLPEDSERYFEKEAKRFMIQYGMQFEYKVVNLEYIEDILYTIKDTDVLDRISSLLYVNGMVNFNAITEGAMVELISKIELNIAKQHLNIINGVAPADQYDRVSTVKKIEINKLQDIQDHIEKIITELDVVEGAVKKINQDLQFENKFERVKKFVVARYEELAESYKGVELYDKIIASIIDSCEIDDETCDIVEFLVVYIFDKCDIFEKE